MNAAKRSLLKGVMPRLFPREEALCSLIFAPCGFAAFQGRSTDTFHNMFVPWVLLIQADASIGDTAFQSAEAGEEGLKQCPSVPYL